MKVARRLVIGSLLLGCGSSPSAEQAPIGRPRGVLPSRIAPEQKRPAVEPRPMEQPASPEPQATKPQVAKAEEKDEEPEKKRDYNAELLAALGTPNDCLKPRQGDDSPAEIKVELEGHFLETGAMSRAYARSAQLAPEELQCVSSRLQALRLAAPVEEAPRTVQATLTFKLKTAETAPN